MNNFYSRKESENDLSVSYLNGAVLVAGKDVAPGSGPHPTGTFTLVNTEGANVPAVNRLY